MSENIGLIISKRRKELGLTMEQVADSIGVNKGTVSRWERGEIDNMRRDKIAKLADVLNVSPLILMGMSEAPATPPPSPSTPAARPLTLEEKERAIKEWFTAIAKATGNEKALDAIDKIHLVESTGQLRLADTSDLNNSLLQLQAASLLQVLEKAQKEGKTAAEWHTPQEKE